MRETWYVLEDGSAVDPNEVAPDAKGVLRHGNGMAIAMRGQVPSTRGVNPEEERSKAALRRNVVDDRSKEMKPEESKRSYKTREAKAE